MTGAQRKGQGSEGHRVKAEDLNVSAVRGEVHLDDEAQDIFTVANPVERWSQRKVVEINSAVHRTHRQEAIVRTEAGPQPGFSAHAHAPEVSTTGKR